MRDKRCFLFVFFLLIHRDIGSMQGTVCIGRFRIDFYYAKTGTRIIQINISLVIFSAYLLLNTFSQRRNIRILVVQ